MYVHFNTDRLLISPLTIGDADFILELVNTAGWLKFIGNRHMHSKAQAVIYIQQIIDKELCFYHVIRLHENKTPVGIITFIKRIMQEYYDIGFALLPEYESKGYAAEAVAKYIALIMETNRHEKIIAVTFKNNSRSIALLEKLGLKLIENYKDEDPHIRLYALDTRDKLMG